MAATFLKRLGAGAGLLALSACAYATPYPAAFPEKNGAQMAPADAGRSDGCDEATADPGSATLVLRCLRSRGQAWDNRGRAIRRQSSYVGQLAIPLGVAGLGLSAANDRSDFVPISAGLSTTSLAHTAAYARPGQAEVYELATAAYLCLTGVVADWNAADGAPVETAYAGVNAAVEDVIADLRADDARTVFTAAEINAFRATVELQRATANATRNRVKGQVGASLLQRSNEIEGQVVRAIRERLPDPQTVVTSIAQAGLPTQTPRATVPPSPPTPTAPTAPVDPAAGRAAALNDDGKARQQADDQRYQEELARYRTELARFQAAVDEKRIKDRVRSKLAAVNDRVSAFDAATQAYAAAARGVSINCTFNPSQLVTLTATPAAITLDSSGKGFFVVRNGVPPYGHLPLPTGLTLSPTPISGAAMRYEVSATGAGPWTVYVIDASAAGGMAEIRITRTP